MIGGKHPHGFTLFETVVVLSVFSIALLLVVTIFTNASESQRREAVSQKALADARVLLASLSQDIHTKRIDYDFYKGNDDYSDGMNTYAVDCTTFGGDQCDLRAPVQVLALISDTGEKIRYWFNEDSEKLMICKSDISISQRVCGLGEVDGNPTSTDEQYTDITPSSLRVVRTDFYVTPASDPGYSGESEPCVNDSACACVKAPAGNEQSASDGDGCPEWTSGFCSSTCQLPNAQPTVTVTMDISAEGLSVGQVSIPIQFTSTSRMYDR